ncbi:homeobox protein knotted-1-like 1 [Arachis duranensis]|uniref:Homeobox protein knotted-1-like 1 n=1 Tax=Arachis duranensis TaxID=130453 RepID=A0A6P4DE57_ARADU|nr:homeobox protein knotted-1-like 1 [Arachis duranensis]
MESNKRNSVNNNSQNYQQEQFQFEEEHEQEQDQEAACYEEEEEEEEEDQDDEKNNEILKRRISNHPLYGLLVEAHLECLKVGDISNLDRQLKIDPIQAMKQQNLNMFSQSELDIFMEAYCMALGKLKKAMEEPQQKSMAFINNMHSQLRELTTKATAMPPPSEASGASSSSDCKFRRNPNI